MSNRQIIPAYVPCSLFGQGKCLYCQLQFEAGHFVPYAFSLKEQLAYEYRRRVYPGVIMKKPVVTAKGKSGAVASCPDADLVKSYPNIVEYLTTIKWEDGTVRERSTITLFIEDGSVKLALNDRDLFRSLYVSGESLSGALESLEADLKDDSAEWRPWKGKKK